MARVVFGAKEDKISKLSTYQQHIANRSRGNMGASPTGDLFDKIFSERVEVYSKVEFKTHSVRGTLRRHYYRFICIRLLGSGLIRQRQRLAGGSACFSQPNTTPRPLFWYLVFLFCLCVLKGRAIVDQDCAQGRPRDRAAPGLLEARHAAG